MLADILYRYKAASSLVFTVVFSLSCLIWKSNFLSRTANSASRTLDFFSATFSSFGKGVSRFVDSYGTYENVRNERDALREKVKQNLDMQIELVRLREENNKLRQFLQLPPVSSYPVLQAEVISQDPDNWFRTIIINKGSVDGVAAYMPVVALQTVTQPATGDGKSEANLVVGVVGKVIQVNPHSARILPLTDQFSRIGVTVKRTGHWALLNGQSPQQDLPLLDYLSLGVFISTGDEIVTSGGDGIFPRGLPIGRIGKKIERLGSFQKAEINPAIDFKKLDFVIVIQKKVETEALNFLPLRPDTVEEPKLPPPVQAPAKPNPGAATERLKELASPNANPQKAEPKNDGAPKKEPVEDADDEDAAP
ncbi:MAG TPA: rod shape-determining protein MreC [Turneriella sp.]|nr:rod shape-determining protein MreC [Turneriella sp.]